MECRTLIELFLSLNIIILQMVSFTIGKYNQQTPNLGDSAMYYQQRPTATSTAEKSIKDTIKATKTALRKVGGGVDSDYIPYQVLIRTVVDDKAFRCGGSIYSSNPKSELFTEIITAAHCFPKTTSKIIAIVTAGIKEVEEKSPTRQETVACRIIVHPKYNEKDSKHHHDIALLKLRTPLRKIPKRVEAISITPLKDASNTAQISGWGTKFESERPESRLQVATIELQSCAKNQVISNGLQRCAGGSHGPDACGGDSGGPLICKSKNGHDQFLCGVVSYGTKCTLPPPHDVGVYTNVTQYINWINQHQHNNCKK